MIRNPDHPAAVEILKILARSERLPDRVGGGATDQERAAEGTRVAEIAATTPDQIRAVCAVCYRDVPLRIAALCECGAFVCAECAAKEEDGVCDHVPLIDPSDVDAD